MYSYDRNEMYEFLNIFFFVFHIVFILFNLFGWSIPSLRKLNLVTLVLTGFSWFFLGIFYGWGYCFLTDWHWAVRDNLGYNTTSNSYIHFLILKTTGLSFSENLVDVLTVAFYFAALVISVVVNVRGRRT